MENKPYERSSMEVFEEYAGLLWHWAWLLALMAILAGGISYFISNRQTPVYQASTLVLVTGATGSASDTYSSVVLGQQLTDTYARLMTAGPVLDGVSKLVGYPVLGKFISVQAITSTQLIKITVTDTNPQHAALIANSLVKVFADQTLSDQTARYADSKKSLETELASINQEIQTTTQALTDLGTGDANQVQRNQLESTLAQYQQSHASMMQSYEQLRLAEAQSTANVIQKDPAVAPAFPVQPRPLISAVSAAIVGLFLAAGIIFLIRFLDDSIRDPEEITRTWGIPIIGIIASYDNSDNSLITLKQPRAPVSEAFRSLRTNLQFTSIDHPLRTLLVTSPSPSDGKTTVAGNLGSVVAQSGRSVVVVDSDLRRPAVHKLFRLTNQLGLTEQFINTGDSFDAALKSTEVNDLKVITSGSLPPNPSELLGSEKMSEIIRKLSDQFSLVILDSPPTLLVTDALVLAPRVDGVLLIVKPAITKRAELRHVIDQMHQVKANILGIVLNDVRPNRSRYYRGYYYTHKYGGKYGKAYGDT